MILIGLILLVAAILVAVELVLANRTMQAEQGRVRLSFLGHHEWLHAWALLAIGAGVLLVAVIGYSMIQHGIRVRVRRRRERKRAAADAREQDERDREQRDREDDRRRQLTGPDDGYGAGAGSAASAAGLVATERSGLSHDDLEREEPYGGYYSRDGYAPEQPAPAAPVFRQEDSFSHHDDPVGAAPEASASDRTEQFARPDVAAATATTEPAQHQPPVAHPDRPAPAAQPEDTVAMAPPTAADSPAIEPENTVAMPAPTATPDSDRGATEQSDFRPADDQQVDDVTPPQGTASGHFPDAPSGPRSPGFGDGNVREQLRTGEITPDLSPGAGAGDADTTAAFQRQDPESLRGHAQRRLSDPDTEGADSTATYTGMEYGAAADPAATSASDPQGPPGGAARTDEFGPDELGPDDGVHQR